MSDIPSTEPLSFRAGDKTQWSKSFSDYPATTYSLEYYLSSESEQIEITAAANGSDYLVTITAADSAAFTAGLYRYQARIENDPEIITVGEGIITIYSDMSAEDNGLVITGANALTDQQQLIFWESVRANAMDLLAGKVMHDNSSYAVAGRSLSKYDFDELWQTLTNIDNIIARLKARLGTGRNSIINVQFTSP